MPTEPAWRRWARDARLDAVTGVLVVGFVTLRLVATLGRPVAFFNDSPSYFDFRVWGGVRFPVVTAMYAAVGDHRAIVDVQAIGGALAWAAAAVIAGAVVERRAVRYGFLVVVLLVGLTLPVTRVDNALLSESVALSLTVLLVACMLRYAGRPTRAAAVAVGVVGAVWGLTRQNHAFVLVMGAVVLAVLGSLRDDRRRTWRLAAVLFAVGLLGVAMASSTSQIQQYNMAQILVRRVFSDETREQWFLDHGMPANGRELLIPPYENAFGDPAVELEDDPTFGPWLRDHFRNAYGRYLLTHPGYALGLPFGGDGGAIPLASGTTGYGASRAVLPTVVERAFWPQTAAGRGVVGLASLGIVVAGAVGAVRSRARRWAFTGAVGILLVGAANLAFVTHTAGWEYERLLLGTGIAVRFALVGLLAVTAGGVSPPPPASAEPAPSSRRRDATSTGPAASPAPHTPPGPGSPGSSAVTAADPPTV